MDDLTKHAIETLATALGATLDGQLGSTLRSTMGEVLGPAHEELHRLDATVAQLQHYIVEEQGRTTAMEQQVREVEGQIRVLAGKLEETATHSASAMHRLSERVGQVGGRVDEGIADLQREVSDLPGMFAELGTHVDRVEGSLANHVANVAAQVEQVRADEQKAQAEYAILKTNLAQLTQAHEAAEARSGRLHSRQQRLMIAVVVLSAASLVTSIICIVLVGG